MNESKKIPMLQKICYGIGAGGGCIITTLLSTYLMHYYTDTVFMNVAAISTMMLLCRILDGVTDLVMGGMIDKTRSRWGKARPWLLVSAPLILVATVLVLNVPLQWADSSKLVYVCLTYIFLNCIAFTIFGVSHAALLSRLSSDTKERTNTAAVSGILNNLFGYVIAGAAISVLQINYGWRVTSIVLGISAGALILFAFLGTREQVGQTGTGESWKLRFP